MRFGKSFCFVFVTITLCVTVFAQPETITNNEVLRLTRAGLSENLIIRKIKNSDVKFTLRADDLIDLKKAGVTDRVIEIMMDRTQSKKRSDSDTSSVPGYSDSDNPPRVSSNPGYISPFNQPARIVLSKAEALKNAKTIALKKSSVHPARQALEKELLKRKDWKKLNLTIVRYKDNADLYVEIGYVSLSWITHRYVYRIYDGKSGTVILAGETSSWGSLAKNLARGISKKLSKELKKAT